MEVYNYRDSKQNIGRFFKLKEKQNKVFNSFLIVKALWLLYLPYETGLSSDKLFLEC